MKIVIQSVKNGFVVVTEGSMKDNGTTVHKATEELQMLEQIGKVILDKRVDVKEH